MMLSFLRPILLGDFEIFKQKLIRKGTVIEILESYFMAIQSYKKVYRFIRRIKPYKNLIIHTFMFRLRLSV